MTARNLLYIFSIITIVTAFYITGSGCAQIGAPTGGPRDTIAPVLVNASPKLQSVNVTGNKITLSFNEYVELKDVQNNVLISPLPIKAPSVDYKLKTVTVKLKDTLQPNTTYTVDFGNAIVDINEGNPFRRFTYVFSTGKFIDSLSLTGKIILAETGKADSTIIAMLYRNADDSSVRKRKPDYVARLDSGGNYNFNNLPSGNFKLYALRDGDGGKTYNSKSEMFAFADQVINTGTTNTAPVMYAFEEQKEIKIVPGPTIRTAADKKLKYTSSLLSGSQSLLNDINITFNRPLKILDTNKIRITDTSYVPVASSSFKLDSSRKILTIKNKWAEDNPYRLIIDKESVKDSADNFLAKSDTLKFNTKKLTDYGSIVLRFTGLNISKHPVLQFIQNDEIKFSYALTSNEWSNKLFEPGEYELRILYDDNNNGKWDPGNYSKKQQPEKAIALPQKLAIRGNWENERDVIIPGF
ncbi:MAG: Ig-like domain-containing protein [Ferruginibacter sp.]